MREYKYSLKEILQPVAIITFALLVTTIIVGMIAYANCLEAKVFIDNLIGNSVVTSGLRQA